MARRERVLVTGLGIGLSAVLLISLRQAQPQVSAADSRGSNASAEPASRETPAVDAARRAPAAEIQEFVRLLGRLRANDESVLPELREIAERLCTSFDRCDGREILAFYAAMAPEDRARGLQQLTRCNEIVTRVRKRFLEGPLDEEWVEVRDEALELLDAIAAISLSAPDVYPGACAASFRARMQAEQLLSDFSLEEARREELIDSAREDALNSLAALERCGMLTGRLEPLWVLGHLHAVEGDSVEARRSFEECLALAERVDRVDWQENAYQGLVLLAQDAGDVHEIEGLLDLISRLREANESWFLVREKARLLLENDLANAMLDLLLKYPPAQSSDQREWNLLLGSAYLRKGRLDEARENYALATPLPYSRDVAIGMASVDLRAGNPQRVFDQLSQTEFREGLYPFEQTLALQLRGEAGLTLGREVEAVEDLERALRVGENLQTRLAFQRGPSGVATSVIGECVGLHTLALLAEGRARLGQHLEAARAIENWQSRTLRGDANQDLSTENLLEWARSTDLGLLTWVVGTNSSVVAHVGPDGNAEAIRIAHGRKAIDAAVRRLEEAVLGTWSPPAQRLVDGVRAELLPPNISSRLGSGRLLVLVHGPIERLPIEFLLRDEPIIPIVLPGLPSRHPGPAPSTAELSRWSILGSPVDHEGQPLLEGAREELVRIARMRSASETIPDPAAVQAADVSPLNVRIGTAFDRISLVSALRSTSALHVATHLEHACGRSQGRLADVGFQLSRDEALCAREIAEIRPRLPLAVLSACATAEGRFVNAEGLQGLARAFLESGTRNLVVTLWPVGDESARAFAEKLHENLLEGTRPSEAAGRARASLRDAGFPAADWAAFRLIGRD